MIFYSVISQCIQQLVGDLESACEPALITMAKVRIASSDSILIGLFHIDYYCLVLIRRRGKVGRVWEISLST